MKNKIITDYLEYFVNLEKPGYAVLLKGKWGSGKTHFIQNLLENWNEPEDDKAKIQINPIYISLNGISNTKTVTDKLKAKLSPILYSKAVKVGKKVLEGILKTTLKIDLDINNDGESDSNISGTIDLLSLLDSESKNITGKKILIFDDLERCKIPIDEIFGYINNFVEHTNCKIILVAEEDIIHEKYEKSEGICYKDFKEKLIGRTFEIESDTTTAIKSFTKNSNGFFKQNEELIEEIFIASKTHNLRILKHSLLDYKRLIDETEKEYKNHPNFKIFSKNLLCYFLITSLEYKSGNTNIKHYQSISSFFNDYSTKSNSEFDKKYDSLIKKYSIKNSSFSLEIEELLNYLKTGSVSKYLKVIENNVFFRKSEEKDWEKLWLWYFIDDIEFNRLKKSVWNDFINNKINSTFEILHVSGIYLSLLKNDLSNKQPYLIIKNAKKQLRRTVKNENITILESKGRGYFNSSYGKQYQSKDSKEFNEILDFTISLIKNNQNNNSKTFLSDIFHHLSDENVNFIPELLSKTYPDSKTNYDRTPIFKYINAKKVNTKIKNLNNDNIDSFTNFLHNRYHPEETYTNLTLKKYHEDDIPFLKELLSTVSITKFKNRPIKTFQYLKLENELKRIIHKLDSFDFEGQDAQYY
ncbi:P-loop NTPase fold protein [Flavobacterium rakeshii]|nr:P-loop NTPase fold protein [Flavobacterium rakeshii]